MSHGFTKEQISFIQSLMTQRNKSVRHEVSDHLDNALPLKKLEGGGPGAIIPIGGIIDYYGTTEPAGWLFPNGQAIPAKYTEAIALIGANTPDLRGRVVAGLDNMGGASAARLSTSGSLFSAAEATTLGTADGAAAHTLAAAEGSVPIHNHTATTSQTGTTWNSGITTHIIPVGNAGGSASVFNAGAGAAFVGFNGGWTCYQITSILDHTHTMATTVNNHAGAAAAAAHNNVQPTMVMNKLIRVG